VGTCGLSNALKDVSFSVESDLESLDSVLSNFEQLNQPWIPKKDWLQFKIALAEGFTNAVRHAHRYLPSSTSVDIEICLFTQGIKMLIWDYGPPFDFQKFVDGSEKYARNELKAGGQGIPVLRKISDHLSYTRVDGKRNCLTVIKHFS
jgi:serine/threonine-protein kinase RsbW